MKSGGIGLIKVLPWDTHTDPEPAHFKMATSSSFSGEPGGNEKKKMGLNTCFPSSLFRKLSEGDSTKRPLLKLCENSYGCFLWQMSA